MLFISFNEAEITEQSTNIQNLVHQYNRRFSSEPRTVSYLKKFINNSRGKYKRNECLINVCKSDKDSS